jgi:chemotaxis protein methyltransferase CheR
MKPLRTTAERRTAPRHASPEEQGLPLREAVLGEREFRRLSACIMETCGIKLSAGKAIMLETRLRKRLRALDISSFKDYCDYLFSPQGMAQELTALIDVVTTNKTDFFREPAHFDYLLQNTLPALLNRNTYSKKRPLRIWSAGCSTGEEPYTLAMVLREFCTDWQGLTYEILATDICTTVLETARLAIYDADRIAPVPTALKKKYFLRGKDTKTGLVRIVPELRTAIHFQRLNFMDSKFEIAEQMDTIFCRNVIIYFDRPTQECLLRKFAKQLSPGGYLFLGHSESMGGLDVPLEQVTATIYRKSP